MKNHEQLEQVISLARRICDASKDRLSRALVPICDLLSIDPGYFKGITGVDLNDRIRSAPSMISCCAVIDAAVQASNEPEAVYRKVRRLIFDNSTEPNVFFRADETGPLLKHEMERFEYLRISSPDDPRADSLMTALLASHFTVIPTVDSLTVEGAGEAFSALFKLTENTHNRLLLPMRTTDMLLARKFESDREECERINNICSVLSSAQQHGLVDQRGDDSDPFDEIELLRKVIPIFCGDYSLAVVVQDEKSAEELFSICPEHIICLRVESDGTFALINSVGAPEYTEDEFVCFVEEDSDEFADDEYTILLSGEDVDEYCEYTESIEEDAEDTSTGSGNVDETIRSIIDELLDDEDGTSAYESLFRALSEEDEE